MICQPELSFNLQTDDLLATTITLSAKVGDLSARAVIQSAETGGLLATTITLSAKAGDLSGRAVIQSTETGDQ